MSPDGDEDDDEGLDDGAPSSGEGEVVAFAPPAGGARLDVAVTAAVQGRGVSRTAVQAWIDAGRVRVRRGARELSVKAGLKLEAGDQVTVVVPAPPPPPAPLRPEAIPLAILHQDELVLVLDKPAGLTVHPGAGQREGTLAAALLHASAGRLSAVGGPERPGIVHRLDKDTSGVLVVARDDAAHRHLAAQFHDRTVRKTYLALVEGRPPDATTVDAPIGRHPRDRKRMAVVEGGRAATSRVVTLERFTTPAGDAPRALVELHPATGRTHQLRVHLKHLHCPIVADPTYGKGETFTRAEAGLEGEQVLLRRHALHAARLAFTHPATGARLVFEAPLPPDLALTLEALREATRRAAAR